MTGANYMALTPLGFLERAAQVHPNSTSLIHASDRYTWLQTYQRCRRLASALARRSVTFGSTMCPTNKSGGDENSNNLIDPDQPGAFVMNPDNQLINWLNSNAEGKKNEEGEIMIGED